MFRVGHNNLVNEEDYQIIESDDDLESDVSMEELDYEEERERENQRPLRMLHQNELRTLGEGRVFFWTTHAISNLFQIYKNGIRNINDVVLEVHNVVEPEVFAVTTYKRHHYTEQQREQIEKEASKRTKYEMLLKLEGVLDPENMEKARQILPQPIQSRWSCPTQLRRADITLSDGSLRTAMNLYPAVSGALARIQRLPQDIRR